jgi:hypothetical protein
MTKLETFIALDLRTPRTDMTFSTTPEAMNYGGLIRRQRRRRRVARTRGYTWPLSLSWCNSGRNGQSWIGKDLEFWVKRFKLRRSTHGHHLKSLISIMLRIRIRMRGTIIVWVRNSGSPRRGVLILLEIILHIMVEGTFQLVSFHSFHDGFL